MGNRITYEARPDIEDLKMTNGLSSVFVSVLSLASSALAATSRHGELAVWIASHDQSYGVGCAGFDIDQLPWKPESFNADKEFLLRCITAAEEKTGWKRLDYEPREDWLMPCLEKFKKMIEVFEIAHASSDAERVLPLGGVPEWPVMCIKHRVHEHVAGCPVCND